MKYYDEFEKRVIGASDMACLIVVGPTEDARACDKIVQTLRFVEDGGYSAYICTGDDVEIGDHYRKVASGSHWLRIYDDTDLTYHSHGEGYKRWDIYRAGEYGCIIHWHTKREDDDE